MVTDTDPAAPATARQTPADTLRERAATALAHQRATEAEVVWKRLLHEQANLAEAIERILHTRVDHFSDTTEPHGNVTAEVDGLTLSIHGNYGPRLLSVLGHCPSCGGEAWSTAIGRLWELGALLETFAPRSDHTCQPKTEREESPEPTLDILPGYRTTGTATLTMAINAVCRNLGYGIYQQERDYPTIAEVEALGELELLRFRGLGQRGIATLRDAIRQFRAVEARS